jgi:tetratricopeptide (TPR) repeat protein
MRLFFCIFYLAVGSGQAIEGPKVWSDWLSEGKALGNSGNYSAAAQALSEALTIAERSTIEYGKLVEIHDALAGVYAEDGRYTESEAEYRRVLDLVEKTEGQASLSYAVELASMAVLPTMTGDLKPVILLLRDALSIYDKGSSVDSLTIIRGCLALILRNQKRYQEAEPLLLDAVADLERQKVPNFHLMASFLNDLALLRFDQGRYRESVDLQQKSIKVLETFVGQDHPSLIVPLNNLATTYVKMARFDDADLTYKRALRVCRKTVGENHLDYAVLLENYAVVLRKLGRNREAKRVSTSDPLRAHSVRRWAVWSISAMQLKMAVPNQATH